MGFFSFLIKIEVGSKMKNETKSLTDVAKNSFKELSEWRNAIFARTNPIPCPIDASSAKNNPV